MIRTCIRRHLLIPSLCRPCYPSLTINVLDILFQLPAFLYANSGKYKLVLTAPLLKKCSILMIYIILHLYSPLIEV